VGELIGLLRRRGGGRWGGCKDIDGVEYWIMESIRGDTRMGIRRFGWNGFVDRSC